jgi:hypothetical protein
MSPLRFSLGAFVVLAVGAAAACSSSSNNNSPDASADDGGGSGMEASNPLGINATCGLLGALGGGGSMMCPKGMTCCTMLALPPSASCVAAGSCSGISTECASSADCSSGQVCCAGSADAAPMMFSLDAAAAAGGGGAGGIPNIDPSMFSATCQSSCTATQTQECAMDNECPSGQTCQGFAGPGGAGGEGGAAAGGLGGLGGAIMLPKTCMAPRPDAGNPPPTQDSGSAVDTGTPTPTPDAETPDVAASDAPSE